MWRMVFCRPPCRHWPDTLALTFHQGISDLDLEPEGSHWPSEGTSDRLRPPHYCLSCASMSLHTLIRSINREAQYNWYSGEGIDHINTQSSRGFNSSSSTISSPAGCVADPRLCWSSIPLCPTTGARADGSPGPALMRSSFADDVTLFGWFQFCRDPPQS